MTKLFEGVAERDQHFKLLNDPARSYPNRPNAGEWWETTEEMYWYFLECLPPLGQNGMGFLMSEFNHDSVTCAYYELYDADNKKRYFCAYVDVSTPKEQFGSRVHTLGKIVEAMNPGRDKVYG